MPKVRAAKFDANIRALRGTVMTATLVNNTTTESDYYVALPTAANAIPAGVLAQDVVEPGYPVTSETLVASDPVLGNVNGSTPAPPFISNGRAWALIVEGDEVEVICSDISVVAESPLVIADAYGRVCTPATAGVTSGNVANIIGRAKYPCTVVNQKIRMIVNKQTVKQ